MHASMHVYMYPRIQACMHVSVYVYIYINTYLKIPMHPHILIRRICICRCIECPYAESRAHTSTPESGRDLRRLLLVEAGKEIGPLRGLEIKARRSSREMTEAPDMANSV